MCSITPNSKPKQQIILTAILRGCGSFFSAISELNLPRIAFGNLILGFGRWRLGRGKTIIALEYI